MHLDLRQLVPQLPDSTSCDILTIIQFNSLEILAGHQIVQSSVSDQGTVVQLQSLEFVPGG